jgi:hypothetical protein
MFQNWRHSRNDMTFLTRGEKVIGSFIENIFTSIITYNHTNTHFFHLQYKDKNIVLRIDIGLVVLNLASY